MTHYFMSLEPSPLTCFRLFFTLLQASGQYILSLTGASTLNGLDLRLAGEIFLSCEAKELRISAICKATTTKQDGKRFTR